MPKTQSLSDILKEKLEEYALLTDDEALNTCLKQIGEVVDSHLDELSLNDILVNTNNIPSLFWLMCKKSLDLKIIFSRFFMRVNQMIPLEALLSAPQEGPCKQLSALFYLSLLAFRGFPSPFLDVWHRLGQEIPLESLLIATTQGYNKGISPLYFICCTTIGTQQVFMQIWQRFNQQIPLEAIVTTPEDGPNKGQSVLRNLCYATANDKPEAFMAVWQRFHQQIPLEAFLAAPQEGPQKGSSALWFLSMACKSNPAPFMSVWQRFGQQIPFKALFTYIGRPSVIQAVSIAATFGKPEAFLAVWQRFGQQISIKHLLSAQSNERSVVWWLSSAAGNGYPECFLAMWQRFSEQIPLEELLVEPKFENNGETALWWLCDSSYGNQEAFLAIWNRFHQQLTLEHLLAAPQEGPNKGKFGLWFMCKSNLRDELWKTLLEQNTGIITQEHLDFKSENVSLKAKFAELQVIPLINARNRFFILLNNSAPQSETWLKSIFEEAKKATAAGYCNAFYDLGKFLSKNSEHRMAFKAFKHLPKSSWHFADVALKLCEEHFALVLDDFDNPANKARHLHDSLYYALQTKDDVREMLIQRVASIYIEGKKEIGDSNLVPQEWLEAMHSGTSVDWCINRFNEIKEKNQISRNILNKTQELDVEKAEFNQNQTILKHLHARMDGLKSENEALKKQKTETPAENLNPVIESNEGITPTLLFRTQR